MKLITTQLFSTLIRSRLKRLAHVGGQRRFAPWPPHKKAWFLLETQAFRPSNHTFL
jgi:hypothetical protein